MKTKDLCQLFDLPRSAVRFYRNASLFSLQQDENGYFHYEVEEIAALYEVLKHRRKTRPVIGGHYPAVEESKQPF